MNFSVHYVHFVAKNLLFALSILYYLFSSVCIRGKNELIMVGFGIHTSSQSASRIPIPHSNSEIRNA
jgi:hypothetical protein